MGATSSKAGVADASGISVAGVRGESGMEVEPEAADEAARDGTADCAGVRAIGLGGVYR